MHATTRAAPRRVYMLLTSPDAPGGIGRVSATLLNELAETHYVEVIGLRRRKGGAHYPLDPRVKVTHLGDYATPEEKALRQEPSAVTGTDVHANSALVDVVLPRVLASLEPGTIISSRPYLHLAIARHAPAHCVTIAHEHNNLQFRETKGALDQVAEAIKSLDQYVVLTEADARSYRQRFPESADRVRAITNPAPWPVSAQADKPEKIVVAAGTLGVRKGFDRLIEAYQPLRKQFPRWQVHIYGEGGARKALNRQIKKAGLSKHVFLKGKTDDMEGVLESAGVFAFTSRQEGLGMVLIEAMTKGVPVVSFDCPHGPAEIVVDGVTGRLVPNDDIEAFRAALIEVMDSRSLRTSMGEQALKHATKYNAGEIAQRWRDMFDELHARRAVAESRSG
jgi:glycosyltransferase involved in cell wall biosynthesis